MKGMAEPEGKVKESEVLRVRKKGGAPSFSWRILCHWVQHVEMMGKDESDCMWQWVYGVHYCVKLHQWC